MEDAHVHASGHDPHANGELKILFVEDSPHDQEMLMWALRHLPRRIRPDRVASEKALRESLDRFRPDVILSDFSMPGFGGHDALRLASEFAPHVPFLFVSGTIGEEAAIDALKRGAVDYVLKDNLRRLPSAIERALREARHRIERERMQRALAESEVRFRTIVETSKDWIWENDVKATIQYSNNAVADILGYRPKDVTGTSVLRYLSEASRQEVETKLPAIVAARTGWRNWRLQWIHRDGSPRVLESTGSPLFDQNGRVIGFRGIDHDVTERLRHEAKIRNLARIHVVLAAVGNAVMHAGSRDELLSHACRVAVEQGGFKMAGIGVGEADGTLLRVVTTFGDPHFAATVAPAEPMPVREPGKYYNHPSIRAFRENRRVVVHDYLTGDEEPELRSQMLDNGVRSQISLPIGREPWGLLALYSDTLLAYDDEEVALLQRLVDEIDYAVNFLAKGERLEYLAYHHPLTGLPNAVFLHERLRARLADTPMLVAAVEAPNLGRLAATRGKPFVNRVLQELGAKLQRPGELLAHIEGSTLLLAYPGSASTEQEVEALDRRLGVFERQPLLVDEEQVHLGLRSGLALGVPGVVDSETLEADAMTALANAHRHELRVSAYSADMRQAALRRIALERDLRLAIERGEFELHYQPKIDGGTGRILAAEALLRWRHPVEGWASPAEFIPVLEETGLIVPVGNWVMRQALATALEWRRRYDADFRIAVNVSARELRHRTFLEKRRALLQPWMDDQPIDVEVTESVLMDDIDSCIPLLQALRELGCQVAIDDFGTGYSSLNYLVRLPVDVIKIDRSFVSTLNESAEAVALTTTIISLAHSIGLSLVAEGVEDEEQASLLRRLRCNTLQGYLLGRPMPEVDFVSAVFDRPDGGRPQQPLH